MTKKQQYASYRPIDTKARFWLHSEICYTEEELNQRSLILKIRANSGIHADYLNNPSSWFAEDSQALINHYAHSWFYSYAFKTRHMLTRDDFHVQPIDTQRLQWSSLYKLMQNTGDYLLVRNQNLRSEHLNQPINFFLLDLSNILKGISQNPHIKTTQEQLEHLSRYVRAVEKTISPFSGSDRLFLANFRRMIDDEIQPQLSQKLESQLLKDRLGDLLKSAQQLSIERNRILHFALNINLVNPHSYTFSIAKPDDLSAYPTQAVKECGTVFTETSDALISRFKLTIEQLKNCPNFKLLNMNEELLNHYSQAISDLNELEQFHKVIEQTIDLLGQAGEVFTIYQFKKQLSLLLKQIENFIEESSIHIEEIIHANSQAYHQTIQEEQNLSFLHRLFSYEQEKRSIFIRNQDTLAQYPSTTGDLAKTRKTVKELVGKVLSHLNGPKAIPPDFSVISAQAQELDALIGSMYHWIKIQYENKGKEPPQKPKKISFPTRNRLFSTRQLPASSSNNQLFSMDTIENLNIASGVLIRPHYFIAPPSFPLLNKNQGNLIVPPPRINHGILLGFLLSLSIGFLVLFLIYKAYKAPSRSVLKSKESGTREEFEKIKTNIDDLFVTMQKNTFDKKSGIENRYDDFMETYNKLHKKTNTNNYPVSEIKDLYEDMEYFYDKYYLSAKSLSKTH